MRVQWHWHYTPESGKQGHYWTEQLPVRSGRLICLWCSLEHRIKDLGTATRFCPPRVEAVQAPV